MNAGPIRHRSRDRAKIRCRSTHRRRRCRLYRIIYHDLRSGCRRDRSRLPPGPQTHAVRSPRLFWGTALAKWRVGRAGASRVCRQDGHTGQNLKMIARPQSGPPLWCDLVSVMYRTETVDNNSGCWYCRAARFPIGRDSSRYGRSEPCPVRGSYKSASRVREHSGDSDAAGNSLSERISQGTF
jgi:hypothetical protein